MIVRGALALVCALAGIAVADADHDAEVALRDAQQRAAAGDPTAIDALEALGGARPATRWTDDAWRAAAQLAERSRDYTRAQRSLAQVIATSDDEQAVRRARGDIERLAAMVGAGGEWNAVAATHDRLAERIRGPGDPTQALRELETLVRRHHGYPRAAMAMLVLARGWESEGEPERAITWLREASTAASVPTDRMRANAELVRALVRHGELTAARDAIGSIRDPALARQLRAAVDRAKWRRATRWSVAAVLIAIALAAAIALRRSCGSWRSVAKRLVRPPPEVLFLAPIAAVFVAVAQSGNPLVARAVLAIAVTGTIVAWISGAILTGKRGRLGLVLHGLLAAAAVACAAYLAIDRDRMIDLIVETWHGGPAMR